MTKTVKLTKERHKMMINHVMPDIKEVFPRPSADASPEDRIVWMEQENARPRHL